MPKKTPPRRDYGRLLVHLNRVCIMPIPMLGIEADYAKLAELKADVHAINSSNGHSTTQLDAFLEKWPIFLPHATPLTRKQLKQFSI